MTLNFNQNGINGCSLAKCHEDNNNKYSNNDVNESQYSCSRLTASTCDISTKSSIHSLRFTLDDFDIGGLVGDGAHGQVFLARERRTGFICVLKCISKVQLVGSAQESMFKCEIELHSHLRHPNIACLYTWFATKTMVCMVMEYCNNGDLFTYLTKNERLLEPRVCEILFEVTWAVRTCHDKHIAHLDIKPENILLDHNNSCKLADFGLSEHIELGNTKDISHMRGTYDYWSPEQCAKKNNSNKFGEFNHKSDVWSLGVLAFELYFGISPFGTTTDENVDKILYRIQNYTWDQYWTSKFGNRHIADISSQFRDFLDKCFVKNANLRPSADKILQHPWLKLHNSKRYSDPSFVNQVRPMNIYHEF